MVSNDDLDEFDTDFDDEFDDLGDTQSSRNSSPMMKFAIIGGAVFVIVIGILLFGGGGDTVAPSSVPRAQGDLSQPPGSEQLDPSMVEAMEDFNDDLQEEALSGGGSFLPVPINPGREQLPSEALDAEDVDPLDEWRRIQAERQQQQIQLPPPTQQQLGQQGPDPAEEARNQALSDLASAMSAQMQEILGARGISPLNSMQVTQPKSSSEDSGFGSAAFGTNGAASSDDAFSNINQVASNETVATQLISAGTIEYGQTLIEANSDVDGPILAQIVTGPFEGGRAIGNFEKSGLRLTLRFQTIVLDGVSYSIDAIAVDPSTSLTGIATKVDRRILQRVLLPAAADFLRGLSRGIAEEGRTTVTVNGETVIEQEDGLNAREEIFEGVGAAADEFGRVLDQENTNRQELVIVGAGTPVGILFLAPVFDNNVVTGATAPTATTQGVNQGAQGASIIDANTLQLPQNGTGSININLSQ